MSQFFGGQFFGGTEFFSDTPTTGNFFNGKFFNGDFFGSTAPTDGNYFNGPFYGGGFFGDITTTTTGPVGGAWIETPANRRARKKAEREKRAAWKRLEEDIEEAYAEAMGLPRKKVKPVVSEALAARDPETVKRIAEKLAVSADPAAVRLTQRIDARLQEIEQLGLLIAEIERQAILARIRDEDDAIAMLLLAN